MNLITNVQNVLNNMKVSDKCPSIFWATVYVYSVYSTIVFYRNNAWMFVHDRKKT